MWRQLGEACNPDCLIPIVKHGGGSLMIRTAISRNTLCPIVALHGTINSKDYLNFLRDHVHPTVQALFPDGDDIFQEDNAPMHTTHVVRNGMTSMKVS